MVHYSKVVDGLIRFVDQDMISKMSGSWKAWGIGTVVALIARRAPEVFTMIRDNQLVQTLGLIDGEMVDIDAIYTELHAQAEKNTAKVDIPLIGSVTYSVRDVESLYRLITGA